MISLFPDGTWQVKRLMGSCRFWKLGKFSDCVGELTNHVISDKEIIDNNLDVFDGEYNSEMYVCC